MREVIGFDVFRCHASSAQSNDPKNLSPYFSLDISGVRKQKKQTNQTCRRTSVIFSTALQDQIKHVGF